MANAQLFLNNFISVFAASVKNAATTTTPATELDFGILRLSNGAAGQLINPVGGDYYTLTAFKKSGSVESAIEIMTVTAVDNSVVNECRITVTRAREGTTAQAYVAGDFISLRLTQAGSANFTQNNAVLTLTNKTLIAPIIDVINATPIGGTTPAAGAFTTLSATGLITGTVANTPAGNIAATTVQGAVNELDTEKTDKAALAAIGGAAVVGNTAAGGITETTVQGALNGLEARKANQGAIQAQSHTAVTTVGTSAAYAIATLPVQPTLVAGQRYRIKLHTPNGAAPTLVRDGLAAKAIMLYNVIGVKTAPVAGALPTLFDVEYDGEHYVVLNPLPASGGATGAAAETIFVENSHVMNTSYTLSAGKSASMVGPLTIATGVTLTIPTDRRLVVL